MTKRVVINHHSSYTYDKPVRLGPQSIRLRPTPHCRSKVASFKLSIEPASSKVSWQQDPFGNYLALVTVPEATKTFSVTTRLAVEIEDALDPFDDLLPEAETFPFRYEGELQRQLTSFGKAGPMDGAFRDWMLSLPRESMATNEAIAFILSKIREDVQLDKETGGQVQSPSSTLKRKKGTVRDQAWLLTEVLRHLGLGARLTVGYRLPKQLGKGRNGKPTLHAWTEAFFPGAGWIGLDPTNGSVIDNNYLALTNSPTPDLAAPLSGSSERASVKFNHKLDAELVAWTPEKSSTDAKDNWSEIAKAAQDIDHVIVAAGHKLYTATSLCFSHAPNAAASADEDNETDIVLPSLKLVQTLKEQVAPHGFLHFEPSEQSQNHGAESGTWSLVWHERGKKEALWDAPDPWLDQDHTRHPTIQDAEVLFLRLTKELGLEEDAVVAGFDDVLQELSTEALLDPSGEDSRDDKQSLIDRLQEKAKIPSAFSLLLRWRDKRKNAESWQDLSEHLAHTKLYLRPDDQLAALRVTQALPDDFPEDGLNITVEPGIGYLLVSLPSGLNSRAYKALLRALATVTSATDQPVRLSGALPLSSDGFRKLTLSASTMEVFFETGAQPSWKEMRKFSEDLSAIAETRGFVDGLPRIPKLRRSFLNGRRVTLSGANAEDSPFYDRPDLLRGLLLYWQNYPSLSRLFGAVPLTNPGLAHGALPETLGEPRLYELELALGNLEPLEGTEQVKEGQLLRRMDKQLRRILGPDSEENSALIADVSRLWPAASPERQQAEVTLTGLNGVSNTSTAILFDLLLRAMVARCINAPLTGRFKRWGGLYHDRYCLPSVIWADFTCLINDLKDHGIILDAGWFSELWIERYPLLGRIDYDGAALELNHAFEPLYPEGVDRLSITAIGLDEQRYAILCNGERLPLSKFNGPGGNFTCAGVRFQHHSTETFAPTNVFDFSLIDLWDLKTVVSFSYDVAKDLFDSEDAPMTLVAETPAVRPNHALPMTLDLRDQ